MYTYYFVLLKSAAINIVILKRRQKNLGEKIKSTKTIFFIG